MGLAVVSENVDKIRTFLLKPSVKTVFGNFMSLSSIQVLVHLVTLILLPFVTRALGMEKFGVISFAINFVAFFQFATAYGFNNTAVRTASIQRNDQNALNKLFSAVTAAKIFLAFIFTCLYFSIILFVPHTQFSSYFHVYIILYLYIIGEALFPMWLFMGLERMKFLGIMNFISRILILTATILFVKKPDDYILYGGLTTITFLLNGFAGTFIAITVFHIRPSLPTFTEVWEQLKEGFPVFISYVSIYIYTSCRVIIFGFFADETLIGQYAVGERICSVIQLFPISALLMASLPRLTSIFHNSKQEAIATTKRIQKGVSIYILILVPFVLYFADDLVWLISGNRYEVSVGTLRILFLSTVLVLLNTFRVNFFIVSGDYSTFSKLHVISSISGLVVIVAMTSLFSYKGMAWAIVLLEASILTATVIIQRKRGIVI